MWTGIRECFGRRWASWRGRRGVYCARGAVSELPYVYERCRQGRGPSATRAQDDKFWRMTAPGECEPWEDHSA
jgi:hypothetical protein